MKRKIFLFVVILFPLFTIISPASAWQMNYLLPYSSDTLRILGIGNSFTDDGMMLLPDMLEAAGIKNVILGRLFYGGCSLEQHCSFYAKDTATYVYHKSVHNKWEKAANVIKLQEGIEDEPWDVIVLQQSSGLSGVYDSYHPWLDKLIKIVRFHSKNAAACLAWQQTWSYSSTSTHGDFSNYNRQSWFMYMCILRSLQSLLNDFPLKVVIPSGTAIQNLRTTYPQNIGEYTRDGFHLDYFGGRYTAACAWFQAIIAPIFKTSVMGNTFRVKMNDAQLMCDEDAFIYQLAACMACIDMFTPVNLEECMK